MELDELKQTWTEHAQKLDRILSLNLQGLKTAQLDKTRSALGRFRAFRFREMVVGIFVLVLLGSYIADRISIPTLAIPAFIVFASFLVPVIANIRQLLLLERISYADPVTTIQRKLEEIKLRYLRSFTLPVLMLPLYMAYVAVTFDLFFHIDIFANARTGFLWANLAVSLIFIVPAVWVLRNLSFKNTNNPVIRAFVHGNGGEQMVAALEFLKALQEFEEEEKNGTARQAISR
jgi:hypothetical protein